MHIKLSIQRKLSRSTILLVALLVLIAIPVQAANPNPGILPPNAHPYGLTYGEWGARWWQWALSIPQDNNPLNDPSGVNCGVGQSGKVWFLGGTLIVTETSTGVLLGEANRDCTIPVGTAVFFPIANTECSTIEGNGATEAELRACANFFMDHVTLAEASIDGVPVEGLAPPDSAYRAESPLYNITLPENNILGIGAGNSPSVSDGYWLMLAPLSAGSHEVSFHAFIDLSEDLGFTFELIITYHLNVAPRAS